MEIYLEEVRPEQITTLQEVSIETFRDTYAALNTPENLELHLQRHFNVQKLEAELKNKESHFFFVRYGAALAGYLKLNTGTSQTEPEPPNAMEIERIYVRKAFQRQGLGRILIGKAEEFATEAGAPYLWLGVWEKNPGAVFFYEKVGFRIYGTHIFTVGDDPQTDHMMRKDLFC